MSFVKFTWILLEIFKRANSQKLEFIEKSCDGLSVKISFSFTHVLWQKSGNYGLKVGNSDQNQVINMRTVFYTKW